MSTKCIHRFMISLFLFTALIPSGTALAASFELNVPNQYSTLQSALDGAEDLLAANPANSYTILVEPGSYAVPSGGLVLKSNIPIRGRETARTFIDGGGTTGAAVTANGVTGVSFKNFTVQHAGTGIHVTGNSAVTIANNVFDMTTYGVVIQTSSSSKVINNTFYQNTTAVSTDADPGAEITNNLFYNNANTVQIVQNGILAETSISYNIFYPQVNGPKGTNYIPNTIITNPDPLFVDPLQNDFHIRSNPTATSPCIDNGDPATTDSIDNSRSDIGAYGGATQDSIPFPVSGVTTSLISSGSLSVQWSPNTSYVVNDISPDPGDLGSTGGYNIYYSFGKSGQSGGVYQKLALASTVTSTVISGLSTTVSTPAAPVVNALGFDTNTLIASWSPVSGATGYIVYYAPVSGATGTLQSSVIQETSYSISGLVNLTSYNVWVTAVAQPVYYLAVTAFDYTTGTHTPGIAHESAYSSPEAVLILGPQVESLASSMVQGFPEAYYYNPDLPNKGCFIATAAYGYYDAPQVQALRDFRDRYLETNSVGRAFVGWYYEYGPIGAAALNAHPWLKPVVRAALLPAVGGALFLTRTSTFAQLAMLLLFSFTATALILYKKGFKRGGSR